MTESERWEQPVGDDQMCVEYVGYHARYYGEGVITYFVSKIIFVCL